MCDGMNDKKQKIIIIIAIIALVIVAIYLIQNELNNQPEHELIGTWTGELQTPDLYGNYTITKLQFTSSVESDWGYNCNIMYITYINNENGETRNRKLCYSTWTNITNEGEVEKLVCLKGMWSGIDLLYYLDSNTLYLDFLYNDNLKSNYIPFIKQ